MATIGSIAVAFTADTSPLEAATASVIKSLEAVGNAVDELREKLSGLSSLSVSIAVDSSEIAAASKDIDGIKSKAASTKASVTVEADSAEVEDLSTSLDELGGAATKASDGAKKSQSSWASLLITTAKLSVAAQQAYGRYVDFKDGLNAAVAAATGVDEVMTASQLAMRGLAGDAGSLRILFSALASATSDMVKGFFSADNINNLLQSSLGGLLKMFGMTDDAVRASVQVLADLVTRQVSAAASMTLVADNSEFVGRALVSVSRAYDEAAVALAKFLTETESGRAIASALSQGIGAASKAFEIFDDVVTKSYAAMTGFLEGGRTLEAVSVATAKAFDAVEGAAANLVSRFASLVGGAGGLAGRLGPVADLATKTSTAFAGLGTAIAGIASRVAPAVTALGNLYNIFQIVKVAGAEKKDFFDFTAAIASTAAMSAAMGALAGSVGLAGSGAVGFAGAVSGAGASVAGFGALLPPTIALSIAWAVATGKVAAELQHVGDKAQMLGNLSERFGMSVQEVEKLEIAAKNSGVALQSVVRAQQTFSQMAEKVKIGQLGTAQAREAKAAFDRLNISVEDLKNMKSEDAFRRVAKELSQVEDATKRTQIAMDLFGRTGPQILPMLKSLEELDADMGRLGGTISDLDFERFSDVENSFDRLNTASGALTDDLAIPFTRMQEAFNNAMADMIGGLAPLVGAVSEVIADITAPFAVIIEIVGRVIGTMLRLAAAATKIATAFLPFSTIAAFAETAGTAIKTLWSYVEGLVARFEEFASSVEEFMRPAVDRFMAFGELVTEVLNVFAKFAGLGKDFFGPLTASVIAVSAAFVVFQVAIGTLQAGMIKTAATSVISAAITAAAWVGGAALISAALIGAAVVGIGVYLVQLAIATASTIASCAAMHVAWLFGLGPIGWLVAGIELIGVALVGLWAIGGGIADFFSGWGEGKKEIDAATASVEEMADAAAANQEKPSDPIGNISAGVDTVGAAMGYSQEEIDAAKAKMAEFGAQAAASAVQLGSAITDNVGESMGYSQEEIDAFKDRVSALGAELAEVMGVDIKAAPSMEEIKASIEGARDGMQDLQIRAAGMGQAGADAATESTTEFNKLQQSFADGKITLDEFTEQSGTLQKRLSDSLDAIKKSSPEETLKKNLELFKSLDDAAKAAAKSARDIGAGVQIGDKFFPRSEETKARAKQYADEYSAALDAIKKKLASGGFQQELDARSAQNESAFRDKQISEEEYLKVKMEIDKTSAQEQAQIATEEVNRESERNKAKIQVELNFADNIRKELETAFLSPVQKMQKELDKVRANMDLSDDEKAQAEKMIRKEAREGLIGKTATENFDERTRDIDQARESGLITDNEAMIEAAKAADELASALGIPVDPANALKVATTQLQDAFDNGKISAEELAKGLDASRRAFLESLGIKERPEEADRRRMDELEKRRGKPVEEGGITEEEYQRGRKAMENDIIGQSAADKIAEERSRIEAGIASGAVDKDRGAAALRGLDREKKQAAGLDLSAGEQVQAGVDKINDAFGVAGKTIEEVQATLSPQEFADYQEAIKKNADAVKASLGVEKTGAQQLAESRKRLDKAERDGVITAQERDKAIKKQRDELLSSLGISKTPTQEFEDAVSKINENASELSKDEIARGLKEAKDKFLAALGIEKSPSEAFSDQMDKLNEAMKKGKISTEEFAKGSQKAKDALLQSLGIPLDPVKQLKQRMDELKEAFGKGQITQEEFSRGQEEAKRGMLPGGQAESPVKQFQRDIKAIDQAVSEGLLSQEEGADRKATLQAELQENLKPAMDSVAADRRLAGASDTRSREGVDTFFKILQGRDNPSLKAQLDIKRNTQIMADAAKDKNAAPVIAQLAAR